MEHDDDTIVIIVGDENDIKSSHFPLIKTHEDILDKNNSYSNTPNRPESPAIINEIVLNEIDDNFNEEFLSERYRKKYKKIRRFRGSFVKELREQHPDLAADSDLMISTLAEIMRSTKAPPPPQDHFIMNGVMFECMWCSALFDRKYQVSRHYQEIHGPKYLNCYSCGQNFRRTTNLYAHEKRCTGPDTEVVLRARAVSVGNKGRHRPFLKQAKKIRQNSLSLTANQNPKKKGLKYCTKNKISHRATCSRK